MSLIQVVEGIPVIGTNHSGIPEAILHQESGFLVPERDVRELGKSIHSLLIDDRLRTKMGAAARRHIEKNFDINTQARKLEDFYKSLVN